MVSVYPRLRLTDNEARNEAYYRQQVLLHVPWTNDPPNDEAMMMNNER